MSAELLIELLQLTEEEQEILQMNKEIAKENYTSQSDFVVESKKFLNHNKMIMVRKHTRFVHFPKHKHDFIEINYVYHGNLTQIVGGKQISLKKGELLFLNQHIEHEIEPCEKDDIIINFIIRPDFFDFVFAFLDTENMISNFLVTSLFNHTYNGQFLFYKVANIESIQELIQKVITEIMNPTSMSDSTIKLYIGLLIVELVKHTDKVEKSEEYSFQHSLVIESLNYIHSNYKNAYLFELADKLNQPHYFLSKVIKKATTKTFKELLQDRRLKIAREYLETTSFPITAIVEKVGYDNISYFYRIFKNKYGQTPQKYRKKIRINV